MDSCKRTKLRYLSLVMNKNLIKVIYTWKTWTSGSDHQSAKTPVKVVKLNRNYINHGSAESKSRGLCKPLHQLSASSLAQSTKTTKSSQPSPGTSYQPRSLFDELKDSLVSKAKAKTKLNSSEMSFESIFGRNVLEDLKLNFKHKRSSTAGQDSLEIMQHNSFKLHDY